MKVSLQKEKGEKKSGQRTAGKKRKKMFSFQGKANLGRDDLPTEFAGGGIENLNSGNLAQLEEGLLQGQHSGDEVARLVAVGVGGAANGNEGVLDDLIEHTHEIRGGGLEIQANESPSPHGMPNICMQQQCIPCNGEALPTASNNSRSAI
jgi:hypothetical protein